MSKKNKVVMSEIDCGNWIFPSEDSTSSVQYPISYPLVLELFQQEKEKDKTNIDKGDVNIHLHGPRYITVKITETHLKIVLLKNKSESTMNQEVNVKFKYSLRDLARQAECNVYSRSSEVFDDYIDSLSNQI